MSGNYENAPATKMLASQCVCCGRALVDAISIELGTGPECRQYFDADLSPNRPAANKLVFEAAIAAQMGRIETVICLASEVGKLGFPVLAEKMKSRFVNVVAAPERQVSIFIEMEKDGKTYRVKTPYRRGAAEEFQAAWRAIPGRRWYLHANHVPVEQKTALWSLLRRFFPGKYGHGPQGVFRIPANG
jgi:hypothetical protein